jgi:hypothetical protein
MTHLYTIVSEGAPPYVSGSGRIVVCRVDPEHVVCVPKDASYAKVRVCEYLVIGNFGQALPSTTIADMQKKARFVRITHASAAEGRPHSLARVLE